jgi:hypothetical protein
MKKNLLLILMAVLFASCESQLGTAVSGMFGNLVSGNLFSSSSGDELYEKMKEKSGNGLSADLGNSTCGDPLKDIIPINDNNKSNISKIKDNLCSCKAWGTCDKKSCSCNVLCPDNFKIFDRPGNSDSIGNSLAFTNMDDAFYAKDSFYSGYCWGHALVTQRFNRLASFEANLPKKFVGIDHELERLREYKGIIAKLNNNEPVDIPGFKNLKEFSSDPEVKNLLMDSVKDQWQENAMSSQGISMVTGSDSQGAEYYNKVFDDIEYRINNHQSPAIVFNEEDNATKAHTVLVSGSGRMSTGERYLCLRDNNIEPLYLQDCKRKMILNKDGTMNYPGFGKVGKLKVTHGENANTVEQVNNLKVKCLGDKECIAKKTVESSYL